MMDLRNTPIQRKIMSVILLTCSLVLVLMCTAYMIFEYYTYRDTLRNNVSTLGLVIASNSSAALAFDSQKDAVEILNALEADEHIVAAALYDQKGRLFATYPASAHKKLFPVAPPGAGYDFKDSFLTGSQPVKQGDEILGTLYLKSDLEALHNQLKQYLIIAVLLLVCALFVAYLLSSTLQKAISLPILSLKETARIISEEHDYSVRAVKGGKDELGELTDAFNLMLSQIEVQTQTIQQAEEENAKLAAIVESSEDAIISKTLDGIIRSWNAGAERIFGYRADEIIGKSIMTIIPPSLQDEEREIIARLKRGERIGSLETRRINKNKEILDISLTISPVKNAAGKITGASKIGRDISIEKQIERQIIKKEEQLRLATQAAELGTLDMDVLHKKLDCDERFKELFGILEVKPLTYAKLLSHVHEDDREPVRMAITEALDFSKTAGNYDVEGRVTGIDDKKVRWIRAKGKVFFDGNKKPVRVIGTVLDITDKKQEEIRKNDFIAIVSHELKTPLTSLKAYVQVLLGRAVKEGDAFRTNALTRAEAQVNKMTSMIQDFLSLARLEEGKLQLVKEEFNLQDLIENVVADARFLTSSHIISLKDCDVIHIFADKDKIGQVLINLLSNAIKYSPQGSTIIIGCQKLQQGIKIYVTDEGMGISEKDQAKLFDRFYRVQNDKVKNVSGFGIGLYIVSEILRYHGSRIEVASEEGTGSTFYFNLEHSKSQESGVSTASRDLA